MPTPSNLYAEKIFAEHPMGLWPFDESVDYISLFNESQRDYSSWSLLEGSTVSISEDPTAPFSTAVGVLSVTTPGVGYYPFGGASSVMMPISKMQLDANKDTIAIGAHIKSLNETVISASIGYAYLDAGTPRYVSRSFPVTSINTWAFISETFYVSEIPTDLFYVFVSGIAAHPAQATFELTHSLCVDGITVGQESEEFNYSSLGISSVLPPQNIYSIESCGLISADPYGLAGKEAYYVVDGGTDLLAQNSGIPMVYGASNSTIIKGRDTETPGVVIPSNSALTSSGYSKEYTIEFWMRMKITEYPESFRFFGPVASDDGLYIDGPFIRLKIGRAVISHYVNDFFRPMLIDLKILSNSVALLINGEEVGIATLDPSTTFPDKINSQGQSQDYFGFYANSQIEFLELDCFATYSYSVPAIVAKRRFGYGQAVDLPETVNTAYGGSTAYFDYSFADYTNNYMYPQIGKWYQGISDNIEFKNNILSVPAYQLPELFTQSDQSYESWINSQTQVVGKDLLFSFDQSPGYLYFEKLRLLKEDTRAVYMVFEVQEISNTKKILLRVEDNLTQNYFEIFIENEDIFYNLVYDGSTTTLYSESGIIANTKSFAGIDIDGLAKYFGRNFSAFFGNKSRLSVYVGSDKAYANPFDGYIYSVNFCTDRNFRKISGLFQDAEIASTEFVADAGDSYFGTQSSFWYKTFDGGFVDSFSLDAANTHIASYTLRPRESFGEVILDIATDSYWQDYVPLKYFAQYVSAENDSYYDLDFIQLNLGYNAPTRYVGEFYDTSSNPVKTYVSFQYLNDGSVKPSDNFTSRLQASRYDVLEPGDEWINTLYEVTNGTIVYPPRSISFEDVAIVVHIEIKSNGCLSDIVKVKTLELASQAYNSDTANPIGTRFGVYAYPYRKYGLYFDYKSKNPYRIYKSSSPYLYLGSDNGVQKLGKIDPLVDTGIAIPVNSNISDQYRVVSMQASMMMPELFGNRVKIMEIEAKNYYYRIYAEKVGATGNRGRIYVVDANSGAINSGIGLYINGSPVRDAVVDANRWFMLGITFANILDFDSFVGGVRLTGPMMMNNISHYQSTSLQEIQRQELRPWSETLSPDGIEVRDWGFWSDSFIWNDVLIKSTTNIYEITPDIIYKTYIGTNKIIIDDNSGGVSIKNYEYPVYSGISWSTSVTTPV